MNGEGKKTREGGDGEGREREREREVRRGGELLLV